MRKLPKFTKKEIAFYSLVFISGQVYQPSWVYNNFWFKADFYDSIPFKVFYWQFLLIYSLILVPVIWFVVRLVKRFL
ncbi:MAG: hypothetical protein F2653_01030 [Actinobacteria bacterium]|uniref:Unannotated protein n=1 Tax=freshwater metagenome TaxID=449393 RepID=A0A6J6Q1B3_9ZZZZ|nr:hypothetical protein [Actinomycetota bacterium]MSW21778.1 hypothetical protein [Actinomycetota bacterium]MSX03588.1 hypothetical protein [Actinomycetota bacterium]MSX61687.1 hypothetical protein [Actinomycetota bacterium]MSX83928.1 hypothetical protein [Actinomycetota bacterium]